METVSITSLRETFQIPNNVLIINEHRFLNKNQSVKQKEEDFTIDNTTDEDEPLDYRSSLNTPVYTSIEFLPGRYETNIKGVFKEFGAVDGPNRLRYEAVLLTVSQAKKIIKTEIDGRDGTVKEYIGLDDYQVTVNGVITAKNGRRPLNEIAALKKMLDAPIPIEVANTYLQNLGINYLVLDSYELAEQEGGYSYQTFSLNFLSDVQQEIELTNV